MHRGSDEEMHEFRNTLSINEDELRTMSLDSTNKWSDFISSAIQKMPFVTFVKDVNRKNSENTNQKAGRFTHAMLDDDSLVTLDINSLWFAARSPPTGRGT